MYAFWKGANSHHKDCDLYIETWNVLSLYRVRMLKQFKNQLEKYSIDIKKVLQEMKVKR